MSLTNLAMLALIFLILLFIIKVKVDARNSATKKSHPYQKLNALFTPAERSFYGVLTQAVNGDAVIFGKVRVADVLTPRKSTIKGVWQTAFNKISAKHFDFVLCKKDDLTFICGIELDDSSHNSAKNKARDAFLEAACQSAGFPLIRYRARAGYQVTEVRDALATVLALVGTNQAAPASMPVAPQQTLPASNDHEKTCPKCSSKMTVRVTKKGSAVGSEFWGCSAFPNCRYMEQLN